MRHIFLSLLIVLSIILPVYAVQASDRGEASFINTNWGYGTGENKYNQVILNAIEKKWCNYELPIYPILIKATIAIESSFCSNAVSPSGYAGLMQIGKNEAKAQGLSLSPRDERFIPEKNIMAALGTLKTKHRVIKYPAEIYPNKSWAKEVNNFYSKYGKPDLYQEWILTLGAYNGGGATVLRAMNYCIKEGKDPRDWDNIYRPGNPSSSPLYRAIVDVYGSRYARGKFYEMGNYPVKIYNLASQ
ncbi:MAG: transglycosylase SLT domain-containing protein [Candidatus Eremiobacterota bacterium]